MKEIRIPASKSISNRLLILQYLFPAIKLSNLSTAKDTKVLQHALKQIRQEKESPVHINIGHAGTAMRFLTALLASIEGKEFVLDGSERMRNRPIKILVDALKSLGADIHYLEKEGYPPLFIKGSKLPQNTVRLQGSVSSQYITALLLIAPVLPKGLNLILEGEIVSRPYIHMTLELLKQLGVEFSFEGNNISIKKLIVPEQTDFVVEGDWSSASYFYGKTAVTQSPVRLRPFQQNSIQGDQKIAEYFTKLGVETIHLDNHSIYLKPLENFVKPSYLSFDLIDTPDLAQTLAVTCAAMNIKCKLTGLQTLKIKETDRLEALKTELEKLGFEVKITGHSFELKAFEASSGESISIATYEDHRMAMAFAILQDLYHFEIENPQVVVKSFPGFWEKFTF